MRVCQHRNLYIPKQIFQFNSIVTIEFNLLPCSRKQLHFVEFRNRVDWMQSHADMILRPAYIFKMLLYSVLVLLNYSDIFFGTFLKFAPGAQAPLSPSQHDFGWMCWKNLKSQRFLVALVRFLCRSDAIKTIGISEIYITYNRRLPTK